MILDFSNTIYKNYADMLAKASQNHNIYHTSIHTVPEAFMLLIKGFGREDLDNLCEEIKKKYPDQDCFLLTQGEGEFYENNQAVVEQVVYDCAMKCLEEGKPIGNKMNGKFNTTAWISHSLYEAKLAGELAQALDLNPERAEMLGLLHDIGRKETHTFEHITKGFEYLIDKGWIREAPISLTHSFLNGIGTKSFDLTYTELPAKNEKGEPVETIGYKNDTVRFIESYKYSEYDTIISIADLMALPDGIRSPLDRINDLIERKHPDYNYRLEFLSDFINTLNEYLKRFGRIEDYEKTSENQEFGELMEIFKQVSTVFYDYYCQNIQNKTNKGEQEEAKPEGTSIESEGDER